MYHRIGLRGYGEYSYRHEHGAFDFATKPIDMEDLERTIEKAVEQISFIKEAQKEHHQLEEIQYDLNVAREIQQSIFRSSSLRSHNISNSIFMRP